MNKFRRALLCTLIGLPGMGAPIEQPRLLWQDTVDVGTFDQAFDVDALYDRVFVAGFARFPGGGSRDFLVRAYNAGTGGLLWQDRVNRGFEDYAAAVVAEGQRVFVSGVVGSGANVDWLVRAYDARTGAVLWEDRHDRSGFQDRPYPRVIGAADGLLFVAGSTDNNTSATVRAYDTTNGTLVWQDSFVEAPGLNLAQSLVVHRGRVFVGAVNSTATTERLIVRAYDGLTGKLLWRYTTEGPGNCCAVLRSIAADGESVIAAGTVANSSGKYDLIVLALDAEKGTLAWTDRYDSGGGFDAAYGVAVHNGRVFVQGWGGALCIESPSSDCNVLLRSYNARTGALFWKQEAGVPGRDDGTFHEAILVAGGRLYAALEANVQAGAFGDWLVQAYRGSSGELLWEDRVNTGGGVSDFGREMPLGLAYFGGRLFVVGRTVDAANNWNFVVRAYHASAQENE